MSLLSINKESSRTEIINELEKLFTPYAKELINSGADFSYMNMFADNFKDQLQQNTEYNDDEIFEILNEVCDISWKSQI